MYIFNNKFFSHFIFLNTCRLVQIINKDKFKSDNERNVLHIALFVPVCSLNFLIYVFALSYYHCER